MSHWLDYHMLLVINYFVLMILITPKLVRGSGVITQETRLRWLTQVADNITNRGTVWTEVQA
jgi:hypothetical protein